MAGGVSCPLMVSKKWPSATFSSFHRFCLSLTLPDGKTRKALVLFMIRLVVDYLERPVYLLKQHYPEKLMRKRHI